MPPTPQTRAVRDLFANFIGHGWSAILTLAVVPIYLKLLGTELYALVALHTTLQMVALVLDRGLGTATSREIARDSAAGRSLERARNLVRTLEILYWAGAVLIAAALILSAPFLASRWLRPVDVTVATLRAGIAAMAISLALQFPFGLYSGVLVGLQRHVQNNMAIVCGTTLRLFLPLVSLLLFPRNIVFFFVGHAAGAARRCLVGRGCRAPCRSDRGQGRSCQPSHPSGPSGLAAAPPWRYRQ